MPRSMPTLNPGLDSEKPDCRPADYESHGAPSMACHRVISETPGQPTLPTVETPEDEKHSCWLSEWLSLIGHQFQVNGSYSSECADASRGPLFPPPRLGDYPKSSAERLDPSREARPFNPKGPFPA